MRNLPLHGAAVVNRLGSLEPRSPRDKGNIEFEFPALPLVERPHVTRNTEPWLAEPSHRTAAMFKSTRAGMRPSRPSTPMFLSGAQTFSALFLNLEPWKLTEIRNMYNRNVSTNTGTLYESHQFHYCEEKLQGKILPFSRQSGRTQSKMAPGLFLW